MGIVKEQFNCIYLAHTKPFSVFKVGSYHFYNYLKNNGFSFLFIGPWKSIKKKGEKQYSFIQATNYLPGAFRKGWPLRKIAFKINSLLLFYLIRRKVRKNHNNLVICDEPSFFRVTKHLKTDGYKIIARVTDWYPDIVEEERKIEYQEYLDSMIEVSDVITVTSVGLKNRIEKRYERNAILMQNSVDIQHFLNRKRNYQQRSLKCVYYGALDDRIDLAVCEVLQSSDLIDSFVLYASEEKKRVGDLKVDAFVEYESLPVTLREFDLLVLPLRDRDSNHGRFPMKLLESLASGLLVIAPPIESLIKSDIARHIFITDGFEAEDYVRKIEQIRALSEDETNLRISKSIECSMTYSWDKNVENTLQL